MRDLLRESQSLHSALYLVDHLPIHDYIKPSGEAAISFYFYHDESNFERINELVERCLCMPQGNSSLFGFVDRESIVDKLKRLAYLNIYH